MRTSHLIVGTIYLLAAISGVASLLSEPGPISDDAVVMIAIGLAVATLVSLAGILLARAPWGRTGAALVVVISMVLSAIGETPMMWVTVVLGMAALVGLYGPWLGLWLRKGKVVDAPGPIPVALTSIGAVAFLAVGLAAWDGISAAHWVAAGAATLGAVLFGRGNRLGLWLLRTAVPALAAWAALSTPAPGSILLAIAGVLVGVAAWLPAARRTTTVITPPLPAPVRRA